MSQRAITIEAPEAHRHVADFLRACDAINPGVSRQQIEQSWSERCASVAAPLAVTPLAKYHRAAWADAALAEYLHPTFALPAAALATYPQWSP